MYTCMYFCLIYMMNFRILVYNASICLQMLKCYTSWNKIWSFYRFSSMATSPYIIVWLLNINCWIWNQSAFPPPFTFTFRYFFRLHTFWTIIRQIWIFLQLRFMTRQTYTHVVKPFVAFVTANTEIIKLCILNAFNINTFLATFPTWILNFIFNSVLLNSRNYLMTDWDLCCLAQYGVFVFSNYVTEVYSTKVMQYSFKHV